VDHGLIGYPATRSTEALDWPAPRALVHWDEVALAVFVLNVDGTMLDNVGLIDLNRLEHEFKGIMLDVEAANEVVGSKFS
jgi:hypothetical protein